MVEIYFLNEFPEKSNNWTIQTVKKLQNCHVLILCRTFEGKHETFTTQRKI